MADLPIGWISCDRFTISPSREIAPGGSLNNMTLIEYLNESQRIAVDKVIDNFTVDHDKLEEIVSHFIKEMRKGLNAPGQTVSMIPSYGKYNLDRNIVA